MWLDPEAAVAISPIAGLTMWPMVGEKMLVLLVRLEPHAILPDHHHVNEQSGAVIEGSLTFTIGGEERELAAGQAYLIPSDVMHGAVAGPDGCLVVDVFTPPRDDYVQLIKEALGKD
jgi:quercetin dioxygenase-like cupin family protein